MDQSYDFESAPDAFPIRLANFEGPLDLLLHLIKKHEVDIHDIPIALITQQYLETVVFIQELNLDIAGDFIVMAATLIHIKSKMLLPRPETSAGVEGEEEDPRDALVRLRGSLRRRGRAERHDRDVPRAARDDSSEAREGFPGGQFWPHPRVQAVAAGGRSAPDWGSGGTSWITRRKRTASRRRTG
jgi:hypothetical protein